MVLTELNIKQFFLLHIPSDKLEKKLTYIHNAYMYRTWYDLGRFLIPFSNFLKLYGFCCLSSE